MNKIGGSALIAFAIASCASADRLVGVPIGKKIPVGTYRIEYLSQLNHEKSAERFLGFGITDLFDIEFRDRKLYGDDAFTFDFSANLVTPLVGTSPGISFGMIDTLNRTGDGRRGYVAFTFKEYLETAEDAFVTETTIGYQYGSLSSPFVGLNIPVSKKLRFLAEHNGFRITGGFEIRPFPNFGVKLLAQEKGILGSLSWTLKF